MPHTIDHEALRGESTVHDGNAEASLRKVLDDTTEAMAVHRGGKIVYANTACLKLLGYDRAEQVLGRSPVDFVSPHYRELVAKRIFKIYAGGGTEPEIEERFLHTSGREVPVKVLAMPLIFEGHLATLVHIRDLTARKDLECRLRAADRLASVGFVAAAVVHELTNPLAYAQNNVELLAKRLDAAVPADRAEELRGICERIDEGVKAALSVVRDVRVFSGSMLETRSAVDVHTVLDSVANLVGFQLHGRARLVKRYGAVPLVSGRRARLGQVFANLLVNAAQAIPPGDEAGNEVTIVSFARGDEVVVEIHDTGIGIAPEILDTIFDPFVTTKEHGTGLGLAVSRSMLEEEGGTIAVLQGSRERGTTFVVTLQAAVEDGAEGPSTAGEGLTRR
ncbi:MAG TPA: ATP-binding protein [Polyangiaceae bacterium]